MNSDMTKYCYQHFENAYNIGWNVNFDSTVESKETFDSIFIEKLTLYCENPLNSDLNGVCRETEIDGKKYVKGFGEIRIIDLKKKIRYAAPNVIIDDILNGKYIPPIEFVDAVLTGPTFDSEEYQEFYLNYSEKNFWGENEENLKKIVLSGFVLLLADMVANLILTLDRQFVSALFDINTYSIYSFAYSMLRIVILAISAIATVLYPTLKRMSVEQMKKSYNYSLAIVGMISFGSLMLYYPLCVIVKSFLIEYIDSLVIFRILFPSITINAIISMIMISHYKALGKEKEYFYISVVILIISAIFNMGAYFVSKSPLGFSVASMLVMVLWYIVSNRKLEKTYNINTKINYIYLIVNIVIFYSISTFINNYYIGFVVNSVVFCIITYIIYTKETKEIICQLSKSINNRIKK